MNNVSVNQSLVITEGQTLSTEISSLNQISVFPNPAINSIEIKSADLISIEFIAGFGNTLIWFKLEISVLSV